MEEEVSVTIGVGQRGGNCYFDQGGFSYRNNYCRNGRIYLRCSASKCSGRGKLRDSGNELKLILLKEHDCRPNMCVELVNTLRMRIMKRAKEENKKLGVIFKEECNR